MFLHSSLALMRAAIWRSERWLCSSATLDLRLRARVARDRVTVLTEADEEDDVSDERDEVEAQARAQVEMACSTTAEIAPRRPPKTEDAEDDEDEDELEELTEGDLGRSPR